MSYSTGEIAELCGATVRTVQYYDREGLLKPERFSEGGRWLYGEEGLKTLHLNSENGFLPHIRRKHASLPARIAERKTTTRKHIPSKGVRGAISRPVNFI